MKFVDATMIRMVRFHTRLRCLVAAAPAHAVPTQAAPFLVLWCVFSSQSLFLRPQRFASWIGCVFACAASLTTA
eukprot:4265033-Amphidinium_carterae.1